MSNPSRKLQHEQSLAKLSKAATAARRLKKPRPGWIHTARTALGMSGAALARRMRLSTSAVANLEKSEEAGTTTLRSLREAADAMGCELVYALVPKDGKSPEDLINQQAEHKARQLVRLASTNMALEKQRLTDAALAAEVKRLRREFAHTLPRDLWDDDGPASP